VFPPPERAKTANFSKLQPSCGRTNTIKINLTFATDEPCLRDAPDNAVRPKPLH